jgi:hypothetical protein
MPSYSWKEESGVCNANYISHILLLSISSGFMNPANAVYPGIHFATSTMVYSMEELQLRVED